VRPKILLIDDDPAVHEFMRIKLGQRFAVTGITDPGGAVEVIRREKPDVILCDIEMPGMDGGDVSAQLFADETLRDIPLLFLTGLASPADLTNTKGQLGGRPALSKSAPVEQLIEKIEALLQR